MAEPPVFGTPQEEYERALKGVFDARATRSMDRINAALDVLSMAMDALALSRMTEEQAASGLTSKLKRMF